MICYVDWQANSEIIEPRLYGAFIKVAVRDNQETDVISEFTLHRFERRPYIRTAADSQFVQIES